MNSNDSDGIHLFCISVSFGSNHVLTNFSTCFPIGSRTCIMGPSGCGKTTLLRLILGILPPSRGIVYVPSFRKFSAVFQEDRLLDSFHAVDNVRLVCRRKVTPSLIEAALMETGIPQKSCYIPVRELSGGMARRVAIVRAVLADSDVLLMDEPFKGLDPETKSKTICFILKNLKNRTLIAATHQKEDVELLQADLLKLDMRDLPSI